MTGATPDSEYLIAMTSPTLDQAILFLIKTKTTGKPWAHVSKKEAMHLAAYGAVLAGFLPEQDERSTETQAIIDDGQLEGRWPLLPSGWGNEALK